MTDADQGLRDHPRSALKIEYPAQVISTDPPTWRVRCSVSQPSAPRCSRWKASAEQVEKAVLQHIGNIEAKLMSFDWKGRKVA